MRYFLNSKNLAIPTCQRLATNKFTMTGVQQIAILLCNSLDYLTAQDVKVYGCMDYYVGGISPMIIK